MMSSDEDDVSDNQSLKRKKMKKEPNTKSTKKIKKEKDTNSKLIDKETKIKIKKENIHSQESILLVINPVQNVTYLIESMTYGISEERFADVIRYCIFHLLPADILHHIQPNCLLETDTMDLNFIDEEMKPILKDDSLKLKNEFIELRNIPEYVAFMNTLETNYKYFKSMIQSYCESIYKSNPGVNVYSVSCSCLNYKINESKTQIEVIPNKLILWKGDEFHIVDDNKIRKKWKQIKSNHSGSGFQDFIENNVEFPFPIYFQKAGTAVPCNPANSNEIYGKEELDKIDEIQFMSQIIFYIMQFLMDYTQEMMLVKYIVEFFDSNKKDTEFNNMIDSILKHWKIKAIHKKINTIWRGVAAPLPTPFEK